MYIIYTCAVSTLCVKHKNYIFTFQNKFYIVSCQKSYDFYTIHNMVPFVWFGAVILPLRLVACSAAGVGPPPPLAAPGCWPCPGTARSSPPPSLQASPGPCGQQWKPCCNTSHTSTHPNRTSYIPNVGLLETGIKHSPSSLVTRITLEIRGWMMNRFSFKFRNRF